MVRAKGLSTRIRSWDLLNESVKLHLTDMPQVVTLQTELQGFLDQARALDNEQELARGTLRDLVNRRRVVERQGEVVRRRVEAHLRGTFGFTAEQLIQFGVRPRPRNIRRKKAKPDEQQPKPATEPTPAPTQTPTPTQ